MFSADAFHIMENQLQVFSYSLLSTLFIPLNDKFKYSPVLLKNLNLTFRNRQGKDCERGPCGAWSY